MTPMTAVSVPDDVFERAERLALLEGRSRSDVYSAALREYVARHAPDEITEGINRSVTALGDGASADRFIRVAGSRLLRASDW